MITRRSQDMSSETFSSLEGSFGTEAGEEGSFVGYADGNSVGSVYDGDWGIVSEDGMHVDSATTFRSGILIVSGSEGSDDEFQAGTQRETSFFGTAAADLSVPGTDSVPTDLDSIEGVIQHKGPNPEAVVRSQCTLDGSKMLLEEDKDPEAEAKAITLSYLPTMYLHHFTKALALFLFFFLVWECHYLKTSTIRLQEELRQLQAKQNQAENQTNFLLKNARRVPLPHSWTNESPAFSKTEWNSADGDCFEDVVLADNCWVRAKASISLGSCASDAKESLRDLSTGFYQSFEILGNRMKESVSSFTTQATSGNFFENGPLQKAGVSVDAITEATSAFASAAVAASDVVSKAVRDASAAADDYLIQAIDLARDAIDEATQAVRLG